MVVIPFRDPIHYHYESPRGNKLARAVAERLAAAHESDAGAAPAAVSIEELAAAVRDRDPKEIPFPEVGRRTQADLVLLGHIARFETRRKGDVGFLRGAARVEIFVFETARPEKPLFKGPVEAVYPPEDYSSWGGVPIEEGAEDEIEAGLIASLANRIARLFYAHEAQPDEKGR
jgi:hypothetical protein